MKSKVSPLFGVVLIGFLSFSVIVWSPTQTDQMYAITDLGDLGGGGKSEAYAINDKGEVSGLSRAEDGMLHAFVWTHEGGMRSLGAPTLGKNDLQQVFINEQSHVIGIAYVSPEYHCFIRSDTSEDWFLGAIDQPYGAGREIMIQRVGAWLENLKSETSQASEALASLGIASDETLPATEWANFNIGRHAISVNSMRTVVGYEIEVDLRGHKRSFQATKFLHKIGVDPLSIPPPIHEMIHPFELPKLRAFRQQDGELLYLQDLLVDDEGWNLHAAMDVNNHGEIVGYGKFEGQTRAFLFKPILKDD